MAGVHVATTRADRVLLGLGEAAVARANLYPLAAAFLLLSAPIILFVHPALLDYQNHLARLWLIAGDSAGRVPTPFYSVDWRHINGDMGIDVLARMLGPVLPVEAIGRISLAAAILLPVAGTIALNGRLFGGFSGYQCIIPVFAWTVTVVAGFLNFQIGLGLALLFAAIDPMFQRRGPWLALAARCLCGVVLFLDHGLALLFYSLLLAGTVFGPDGVKGSDRPMGRRLWGALAAALACLAPVILITLVSHILPGNRQAPGPSNVFVWNNARDLAMAMVSPLVTYNLAVDALIALLLAGVLVYGAAQGRVRLHVGLVSIAIGLVILEAFMPSATPQGGWTDRRLPVMALLAGLSAVQISFEGRRAAEARFVLLALLLVGVRTTWIGWNWRAAERLSDSVAAAIADVPAGAAILPLQHAPAAAELNSPPPGRFIFHHEPTYRHLPAMAVPLRRAFVPTLFTQQGVHPIRVNSPWDRIAYPEGGDLASANALADPALIPPSAPYVRLWRSRFDYVLVLNADFPDRNGATRLPPALRLVRNTGFAALYRIAP